MQKTPRPHRGFAIVPVAVILGVVLALGIATVNYTLFTRRAERRVTSVVSATQLAEAGIAKAKFCLNASVGTNCGGTFGPSYAGEPAVPFGGGTYAVAVGGSGSTRTVTATGTAPDGTTAVVAAEFGTGSSPVGVDFDFALVAGVGGIQMQGSSTVSGDAYASAAIACANGAVIQGSAHVGAPGIGITNCDVSGSAYADRILSSDVDGDAYYRTDPSDIAGTSVGGTRFPNSPTPAPATMPAFDFQLWRDAAEAGGTVSGDLTPADGATVGPVKITGDLTLENNVDITVGGPIWVQGNILTTNNASFNLDPSFGPNGTVIMADAAAPDPALARITLSNNTVINGSGDPESRMLFASTNAAASDAAPAIDLANNAGGALFLAPDGTIKLENNATVFALAARRLYLDNNAAATQSHGGTFTMAGSGSDPGGAWKLVPGTWRKVR